VETDGGLNLSALIRVMIKQWHWICPGLGLGLKGKAKAMSLKAKAKAN